MDDDELMRRFDRIESFLALIAANTKPERFWQRIVNLGAAVVGILGVVAVIDQIITWFKG
ncbi:MAG: hypothetical protein LBR23_05130 [Spirochaetaceae bacterium]|jgi:hypothetical protein|nr:hypothetical protein [Spirochaetaceae bacterium]